MLSEVHGLLVLHKISSIKCSIAERSKEIGDVYTQANVQLHSWQSICVIDSCAVVSKCNFSSCVYLRFCMDRVLDTLHAAYRPNWF